MYSVKKLSHRLLSRRTRLLSRLHMAETRPSLDFVFSGFTLWLMLEDTKMDIPSAIAELSSAVGIEALPIPHVTLFYNVAHESSDAALSFFQTFKTKIKSWPPLEPIGCVCDTEYAGVDGGLMDMTWAEISFKTNSHHLKCVEDAKQAFGGPSLCKTYELDKWKPHLSMAYDNPVDTPLTTKAFISVASKYPSLWMTRKIIGVTLVDTNGKIGDWKVLDSFEF